MMVCVCSKERRFGTAAWSLDIGLRMTSEFPVTGETPVPHCETGVSPVTGGCKPPPGVWTS